MQMDGSDAGAGAEPVLSANQLFYKVLSPNDDHGHHRGPAEPADLRGPDHQGVHLSNADATEVLGIVQNVVRMPGTPQTTFQVVGEQDAEHAITLRAPTNIAAIIERVVELTDEPKAEVVVDVEILEVNRRRVKKYGLDLGDYAIGAVFSPDVNPIGSGSLSPQPFNLGNVVEQRHQLQRLLSGGAGGDDSVPRERFRDEAARQAAAARRGGREAEARAR